MHILFLIKEIKQNVILFNLLGITKKEICAERELNDWSNNSQYKCDYSKCLFLGINHDEGRKDYMITLTVYLELKFIREFLEHI